MPTNAVRRTSGCWLKIASQRTGYIGPAAVSTRWATRPQNQNRSCGVEVAAVAHAMPDVAAVGDFRQGVGLDARDVTPRDHRPADDQFADLAGGQFFDRLQRADRPVDHADHLPLDARKPPADADAGATTRLLGRAGLRVASTSVAEIVATGRASVAP